MYAQQDWKKISLQALKIAVGSSLGIYIAQKAGLQNATSAGSIALLTLVTTKWETVKLSLYRVITFCIAVVLAGITMGQLHSAWIAYGIYILLLIGISQMLGWQATISVNAVIGTHFLMSRDFSRSFVINEFLLVFIGISIAVILNLFYDYRHQKNGLVKGMRDTENRLQMILGGLAAYLSDKDMQRDVWKEIRTLETDLQKFIRDACEYQDNTFHSHPGYYIDYFEMRLKQLGILHNLHYEIKKIRKMPQQAQVIAQYMMYMADYVVELNLPEKQLDQLREIFDKMKQEPLPVTREEFEGRAVLYHILMDLEEFLIFKKRFVENLNPRQLKEYWKKG